MCQQPIQRHPTYHKPPLTLAMLDQASEFRTVNIYGGAGGDGGTGGEQGGSGGVGEGPTANFGVVNADTIVIQNHWPDYAPVGAGSSDGTSYESSGTSYNSGNIFNVRGMKRRREETEDESASSLLTRSVDKRRRLNEDEDEIEIISSRNLKLIREIGSGPGYFVHAGQNNSRAVLVKVFNLNSSRRVSGVVPATFHLTWICCKQLESTVALSKGIMHPNVLRLLGISSPAASSHFIVYENGKLQGLQLRVVCLSTESIHWQNAEGPLAVALKTDLKRSVMLGFRMVAGLSAGLNYLFVQGVFVRRMGVENFDISLDVDDRFVISVHPRLPEEEEGDTAEYGDRERNAWVVFNALCNKTLTSANRVLYPEGIPREPAILDVGRAASEKSMSPSQLSFGSPASLQITQGLQVPRREYVWRIMDRGYQSLENIARRMTLDLDMEFRSLPRMNWTDGRASHRYAGYAREGTTLATTILNSGLVAYDAPNSLERCLICQEIVDLRETLRCRCGDLAPGTRHTIKCRTCKFWSHSDCVGDPNTEFTCWLCMRSEEPSQQTLNEGH
ncbi:hypothetical protein MSAN_01161200 [Mycena sanguinolenta]|uniref:Zinc finger PHD-type domain-containing protein n=1 Tax=Mycena sanguinolenta TaxID=230812 RepID=A0A8H7D6L6_9AGAR|nr:hypothetical protein MSAN_01161200 [Mycena sanguinolenta]